MYNRKCWCDYFSIGLNFVAFLWPVINRRNYFIDVWQTIFKLIILIFLVLRWRNWFYSWWIIVLMETALTSILCYRSNTHRTTNCLAIFKVGIRSSYINLVCFHYVPECVNRGRYSLLKHRVYITLSILLLWQFSLFMLESFDVTHDLVNLVLHSLEIIRYLFLSGLACISSRFLLGSKSVFHIFSWNWSNISLWAPFIYYLITCFRFVIWILLFHCLHDRLLCRNDWNCTVTCCLRSRAIGWVLLWKGILVPNEVVLHCLPSWAKSMFSNLLLLIE